MDQHQETSSQTLIGVNDWRQVFEQSADLIFISDEFGNILEANNTACQTLGYSLDELKALSILYLDCDHPKNKRFPRIKPGKWLSTSSHIRKKSGETFPAEVHTQCFVVNEKNFIISLIRDTSEHEAYVKSLLNSNERIQLATQAAHMGIWEWNIIEDKLIWDDRMLELYGLSREEFESNFSGWLSYVHPDDRKSSQEMVNRAAAGEIDYDTQYRIILPDSSIRVIKSCGQVIRDDKGKPTRLLGVDLDITTDQMVQEANKIIAEVQWHILHTEDEDEIFSLVGKTIQKITGDSYVITFKMSSVDNSLRINNIFEKGTQIKGMIDRIKQNPLSTNFKLNEIPEDLLAMYKSGKLHRFNGGLYEISLKKKPASLCRWIETELGIISFHTMGFAWEGNQYGGVIIASIKDITPVIGMIESLTTLSTQVIKKLRADKALQTSETRFRDLFENSPISLWEEDLSELKQYLGQLCSQGITDFKAYFSEHLDVVAHCGRLIKVLNTNNASLALLHAKSKEDLYRNMKVIFGGSNYPEFYSELVAIAEGKKEFSWEGTNYTLDGEPRTLALQFSVAPSYEDTLGKVFVSAVDVT